MIQSLTFVFFGIVGSGKGTQVKLLDAYLKQKAIATDVLCTSTGDEYRKVVSSGNYTATLIQKTIDKGHLQPNFLTTTLFTNILINNMKETTVFIADGYPRTIEQSQSFESAMQFYNRNLVHVIYIELGKDEATKRMKLRGRSDDTDEGIAKRFDEYMNNVVPSMNYFKDKSGYVMHVINGEQSIEAVHQDIIKSLGL